MNLRKKTEIKIQSHFFLTLPIWVRGFSFVSALGNQDDLYTNNMEALVDEPVKIKINNVLKSSKEEIQVPSWDGFMTLFKKELSTLNY